MKRTKDDCGTLRLNDPSNLNLSQKALESSFEMTNQEGVYNLV